MRLDSAALKDRVILITGANGGLGRATALACAQTGAIVVLLGRKVNALEKLCDEIELLGFAQPAVYPLDLEGATPQDYADLADTINREYGRLDGIVHAAAHFDGLRSLEQLKPMDWMRAQHINVTAPFLLTQACLPLLSAAPDAALVFVLDDKNRMGKSFWASYGVAKFALEGLVSILHEETDTTTVRVHALLPGPMRTALRRMAYFGEDTLTHPTPESAGQAVAYLLSKVATPLRGKILDLRPS